MRSLLVVGSECHSGVAFLYFDAFTASLTLSFALVKSAVNYMLKNLFYRVASSLKRVVQFLHFILSLGIKTLVAGGVFQWVLLAIGGAWWVL